jgi:hypothetical protein
MIIASGRLRLRLRAITLPSSPRTCPHKSFAASRDEAQLNSSSLIRRRQEIWCSAPSLRPARYTGFVYVQKLRVEVVVGAERRPCPLDWLDNFCMRNFTGEAEFDDTLPIAEGLLEAGFRVHPERLAEAMSAWFTQRGKGQGQPVHIQIRAA